MRSVLKARPPKKPLLLIAMAVAGSFIAVIDCGGDSSTNPVVGDDSGGSLDATQDGPNMAMDGGSIDGGNVDGSRGDSATTDAAGTDGSSGDAAISDGATDATTSDGPFDAGLGAGADCGVSSECATGLLCCYPCGIPGCHNKCAQPDPMTMQCRIVP